MSALHSPDQINEDFELVDETQDFSDEYTVQDLENDPELLASKKRLRSVSLSNLSVFSGSTYPALIFEAGSFGLRGALVKVSKHGPIIEALEESPNVDFTQAIAEVLQGLKVSRKRLPRKALLITPSVISALVDLPVSPLRPLPKNEMQELIQWEVESAQSVQKRRWLIGSMLVERGYLSAAQRDEILSALKLRLSESSPNEVIRFGELAVELGYLTQVQLDECFSLQGKLTGIDDELVFGWCAEELQFDNGLSDDVLLSKEEDKNSSHPWYVSGLSQQLRRRWVGAFALNGIRLEQLYPAVGATLPCLLVASDRAEDRPEDRSEEQLLALLELRQEQIALLVNSANGVISHVLEERLTGKLRSEEVLSLLYTLPETVKNVFISANGMDVDDLLFTVRAELPLEYHLLNWQSDGLAIPEGYHPDQLYSILGVAQHAFGFVGHNRCVPVVARDNELSFWRKLTQPKALAWIGAALLFLAASGFMAWMYWNLWEQSDRLAELEAEFERDMQLKQQYSRIEGEQKALKEKISLLLSEKALNRELLDRIAIEKPQELVAVPAILNAISANAPKGVTVTSVVRFGAETEINAESFSETEALEFVYGLNKDLEPLLFQVQSSRIDHKESGSGKYRSHLDLGFPYAVNVVITQKSFPSMSDFLQMIERAKEAAKSPKASVSVQHETDSMEKGDG